MAIPETLPLNVFGSTVVAQNSVIAAADQTITTNTQLSVDGSTYIRFTQATGATLNITLPFAVNGSGALDYSLLPGQTRVIFNASTVAADALQVRRVLTVDANGNPATYSNILTLQANVNPGVAGPAGATFACDGSSWIVVAASPKTV